MVEVEDDNGVKTVKERRKGGVRAKRTRDAVPQKEATGRLGQGQKKGAIFQFLGSVGAAASPPTSQKKVKGKGLGKTLTKAVAAQRPTQRSANTTTEEPAARLSGAKRNEREADGEELPIDGASDDEDDVNQDDVNPLTALLGAEYADSA